MKYYKICKYDYSDPAYQDEWTTPDELIRSNDNTTGADVIPPEYFCIERKLLNVVAEFFCFFRQGSFEYKYFFYDPDDYPESLNEWFPSVLTTQLMFPLEPTIHDLIQTDFNSLSLLEKVFLFQLSLRAFSDIGVVDPNTGACITTMDEGFYWFVAIPDEFRIEDVITERSGVYIYDWVNIYEEELDDSESE